MNELYYLVLHYLNAIWRRRWFALLGAWCVAIPGWLVVASMPSIYESSSRIYVDTSSVLQPLLRGIAVQSDLGTQVNLMKQTLLSRPNLLQVARKTDYDLSVKSDAEMQMLLDSIRSRTTVLSNREDVFAISFEDPSPQRARDVVQALLTIFVESNLGESRQDLDTAEEFIDRQIADYERRLKAAEDKLARFKQDHVEVALGRGSFLERASAANERLAQLQQSLSVAVAQRNLLSQELQSIPATLPMEVANSGPPDDTEYRIIELEATLRQLLSQYTPKHPDVVSAQRQLDSLLEKQAAAKAAIEKANADGLGAGPGSSGESGAPNPLYSEVKLRLIEVETQIEDLRRRAANAQAEAETLAQKAHEVPEIEAEYQRLNRDYDIVKGRHDELLARRESARMSRSRDEVGQEVQYRLIDPPNVPTQPIGPNRPLYIGGVLGFALASGLGVALLLTLIDTSFSTAVELRNHTGLPVLGSVSDNRRKSMGHSAGSAVVLACGVLALVGVCGILLVLERQYGLDTLVSANLGLGNFNDIVGQLFQRVLSLLSILPSARGA